MKELLEYINRNDEFTVSKPLPHVTTIKWGDGWDINQEELVELLKKEL